MILSYYYKYIFFLRYSVIGFFSILIELFFCKLLLKLDLNIFFITFFSLLLGIFFAFYFNVNFNFKIKKSKLLRAFIFFLAISFLSWSFQYIISKNFNFSNYENTRLIISGTVFIVFYLLHRKFSFKDIKRVGVAVYLKEDEDINEIFNKVTQYPDFIHVDIVDKTYNDNKIKYDSQKIKLIKKLWPNKEIHVHIMSANPSDWIDEVKNFADLIFIHWEIEEDINILLAKIKKLKIKSGIAIKMDTSLEVLKEYLNQINSILLMSIDNIGQSGNTFSKSAIFKIQELKKNYNLSKIRLCADGGISDNVIMNVNCEDIVSGSFILNSNNPKLNIVRLKASTQYEIL